jgi:magnesium chelatase family protein
MLARQLPKILPPLSDSEALELTRLQSIAGTLGSVTSLVRQRPFRAPHRITAQRQRGFSAAASILDPVN